MDNLKPWNGIFGGYRYTHPEGLEIAPDGCIYYTDAGGDKCVWCAPSRLLRHMVHLYQNQPPPPGRRRDRGTDFGLTAAAKTAIISAKEGKNMTWIAILLSPILLLYYLLKNTK